jgi:hypothetical protein
MDKSYDYV